MPVFSQSRRTRSVAIAVAALGVTVSLLVTASISSARSAAADEWLEQRGEVIRTSIESTVKTAVDGLQALAAFIENSELVTPEEFSGFVQSLDPRIGLLGVAYMPVVLNDELDAFEASRRASDPGYVINSLDSEGIQVPVARDHNVYFPVDLFHAGPYLAAEIGDGQAAVVQLGIGFDAGSPEEWGMSLQFAVYADTPLVSEFTSVGKGDQVFAKAFIVAVPVHVEDTIQGLVAAPMVDLLLTTGVDLALTRGVSWTIKSGASESDLPEGRSWTQTIELPGATWVLIVVPEEGEIPVAGLPVWMVLGAGLLVTLLVTYLFLLVGQRTQAKSQMEEMERTAAEKDRFLASVSHELRTPLTVVTGLAHELKDNVGHFDAGELAELLDMLARQSDEVAAIVEDLLVAVRGNLRELPLSLGPVELASETRRVIDGCGMTVPVIGSPTHAWADAGRVRQIIRNLVVNADRYGGPEKQVRVGTENGGVWVEVADSGPPIPDDVQSRMFDPYVSASGKRSSGVSSMGLGLHISQRLAELLKGSLSYRHEGAFGLFTLRLPAAMKTAPASGSRGPAAEGAVPSASSSGGHPGGRRHSLENSPSR